jgi:hypothetical protein
MLLEKRESGMLKIKILERKIISVFGSKLVVK